MNSNPSDIKSHGRFEYSAINDRPDYCWPDGKRLAVYIGPADPTLP